MDLGLSGLRVLVTAGAGGIGLNIASSFVAEGANVHVCDIDQAALDRLTSSHPTIGRTSCDVSDRRAVDALFAEVDDRLGGIDCLVNNAGIAGPTGRVDEIEPDAWDRTLAINITGQFNCARKAISRLLTSSNPSIVNLSSAAGKFGFRYRSPYAASKWAVIGFTKSLSMELGEFGVRVNAVLPGIVAGERQDAVLTAKAEKQGVDLAQMKHQSLELASIKEMITPEQISDTILFLSSSRAKTISGQAISVCGDLQSLT